MPFLGSMNKKVDELQQDIREKAEEVEKARELQENMFKKVESQSLEVVKHTQLLSRYGEEKRMLITKLEKLENDVDLLQKEIADSHIKLEEGRTLQEQLLQQIDVNKMERLRTEKEFEELENEKQQVLAKLKTADEKVDRLQLNLWETMKESSEGTELHAKLLQQIEATDSKLTSERRKRKEAITAYKKLKSQNNFICAKYGLITENKLPLSKVEDESELLRHNQSPLVQDVSKVPNAFDSASEEINGKISKSYWRIAKEFNQFKDQALCHSEFKDQQFCSCHFIPTLDHLKARDF